MNWLDPEVDFKVKKIGILHIRLKVVYTLLEVIPEKWGACFQKC